MAGSSVWVCVGPWAHAEYHSGHFEVLAVFVVQSIIDTVKDPIAFERILKLLFWDYIVDPAEAYEVLTGVRQLAGPFNRERLLIRMLERLPWYDLVEVLGIEGLKRDLTPEIIRKLRFPCLKERYEFVRKVLHGEPVSFTGWNPENRAKVGAALLSHRRYSAE